ncbi:hypothetical protein A4V04_00560 [Burkholderiales bacterium YL45]|uniref:DUF2303 domain-containing protein n=1 Tax=Turicimonas muris TaxID=1796652 RepID=A0A227KQQ6_9BURK|nr:DUF2303 family protein [Turicimonas muris]ANU65070.1 hypothetical protein A4V04_00560 [Burkholderiales bacterium YL45]OXE50871.1 hypothetical protein ADH67_00790 [Turicimonas muris]QQQ96231.1 DUF2303 family protein [Turicimonas muris]
MSEEQKKQDDVLEPETENENETESENEEEVEYWKDRADKFEQFYSGYMQNQEYQQKIKGIKAITKATAPFKVDIEGVPLLAVPVSNNNNWEIRDFSKLLDRPKRITGITEFNEPESFCSFVKDYLTKDSSLYMKADLDKLTFKVLAVFNDNKRETSNWCDQRAYYVPCFSPEWKEWNQNNATKLNQVEMAEFIENHIEDIYSDRDKGVSAAEVYEAVSNLHDCRNVTFSSRVNVSNGMASFAYTEKTGGEKKLEVPTEFLIAIPIFASGQLHSIRVKLRYRINRNTGELTLWFELMQIQKVFKRAIDTVADSIKKELKGQLPIYTGALPD